MSIISNKEISNFGYIRFFYTFPDDNQYSLYLGDSCIQKLFMYEDLTNYIKWPVGTVLCTLRDIKTQTIIYEKRINIQPCSAYTYILSIHPKKEDAYHIYSQEDLKRTVLNNSLVRFGNFSHNMPTLTLYSNDNKLFCKNITLGQLNNYTTMPTGKYTLNAFGDDTEKPFDIFHPNVLKESRLYTFYLIGSGSKTYPFKLIQTIDGASYLPLKKMTSLAF
ncbi:MAG: DUF4397 domain-containing protein [Cellulosilyticaceae bacterium]